MTPNENGIVEDVLQSYTTFISSSKARYKSNANVLKPIEYIENIYKSLKRQNAVDKIENSQFLELIRATQHVIDDRETVEDDNIYPCLLNMAQYLVGVLKSVPRTKIKLKPIEPVKEQQVIPFGDKQVENTNQVNTNEHVEEPVLLAKAESPTKDAAEQNFEAPMVDEERQTDTESCQSEPVTEPKPNSEKKVENDEESDEDDEDNTVVPKHAEPLDEAKELKILARIKKIDEFCQRVSAKIKEFEQKEVSMDELDSKKSNYCKESLLKQRFNEAYQKLVSLCKKYPHLVETDAAPKRVVGGQFKNKFKFKHSRYAEINDKINQKINEKKEFPDYSDVLSWVTEANTEAKLELKQATLEQIARESFEEIGRDLKQRRKRDTESMFDMLIQSEEDASIYTDKELDVKLNENKKIANEKSEKIIIEYVAKQENHEYGTTDDDNLSENSKGDNEEELKQGGEEEEEDDEDDDDDDDEEMKEDFEDDENFPELKSSSLDENSTSGSDENKVLSDETNSSLKRRSSFSYEKLTESAKKVKVEYNKSISCSSQASSCSMTEKTDLSIKIVSCVSVSKQVKEKPVMSTPTESPVVDAKSNEEEELAGSDDSCIVLD